MIALCLQQAYDDDIEILDYKHNFRCCNIEIKNLANYILWDKKINYSSNCPLELSLQFGNEIKMPISGLQQQAELLIFENKIILKNKDKNNIIYQLMEGQMVQMENVFRINQYSVNFDKKRNVLEISNGLNKVHSFQLTSNRQLLMMNGQCFGVAYQNSNGEVLYSNNKMPVYCKIKQNEEVELQNLQIFQLGTTQLYIEYQFY